MAVDKHPKHSEAGDADTRDNPVHTGVTKDTASTPGYFRLFMPGLAARYIIRYLIGTEKEAGIFGKKRESSKEAKEVINAVKFTEGSPEFERGVSILERWGFKGHYSSSREALSKARHNRETNQYLSKQIDGQLREQFNDPNLTYATASAEQLNGTRHNRSLQTDIGTSGLHHDRWETFKADVKRTAEAQDGKARTRMFDRLYDYGLGIGSTLLTLFYAARVSSDIRKVFAETVSYENGKDPQSLKVKDFWQSDNVLVQSTVNNFIKKNAVRLGTDGIFFLGPLMRLTGLTRFGAVRRAAELPFADLGVGVKGGQLLMEIQSKETTVLEYLLQLIDSKLNPTKGIGEQIKPSELIDLYQKWASIRDPKAAFRDATIYQGKDAMSWAQSEIIFTRVAELLNGTYKYKHADNLKELDDSAPNFALPKFLYLLGHDMIDTYHPERTLAYVEVANRYGIEAVKQMKQMCARDIPLEQVLERFPVSLDLLKLPPVPEPVAPAHAPAEAAAHGQAHTPVPISFFPAKEASLTHSNQNDAPQHPHPHHLAHQPLTQVSDIRQAERVAAADPLKEAGRT